jgi:RNA polymerase sigma factor (sigma-70 family)
MSEARTQAHGAIDAVWRLERPKLIAGVARLVRDVGLAEDMAQDALVAALEHWPAEGVPDNPGAWLMATAKNRALDRLRQASLHARKQEELGHEADARGDHVVPDLVQALEAAQDNVIDDDLLRLIFVACHPVLSPDARAALTLKLLCGLSTGEIAHAFLVPEPTMAQRIVRAKKTLAAAQVPFEVPRADALLLADQDRRRWDRLLIRRGLAALERAQSLAGADGLGPYALQAAIAACHARAASTETTDWARIVALYDALVQRVPSPVVELNRAVAVGMAYGPAQALPLVEALAAQPALERYHLLPSVQGDLLQRLGRRAQARAAFERAAALTDNARERELLLARASAQGEHPAT